MSLTDLKKHKGKKQQKKQFTVDEFIDDAENYAKGRPNIVSNSQGHVQTVAEAIALGDQRKQAQKKLHVKHATFTLTPEAINQLEQLAKQCGVPKSRLIRMMIAKYHELPIQQLTHFIDNSVD